MIEKVRIGLHESFGMNYIDVKAQCGKQFEFGCTGWGFFEMPFNITVKRQLGLKPLVINHTLCLDGNGKWKTVNIQMNKEKVEKVCPGFIKKPQGGKARRM